MTTGLVAAAIALLTVLLFVVPAWVVIRDLRSGRRDPEPG
jgi:hypothetical protein